MNTRAALCVVALAGASACGGGPMTMPAPSLDGLWQGTIFSPTDAGGPIALQIVQAGTDISGSVRLTQNGTETPGALTGSVTSTSQGTTIRYTVTYQYSDGCSGSFSGTATIAGVSMDGQHDGQNCIRTFTGTLHATKAP